MKKTTPAAKKKMPNGIFFFAAGDIYYL